MLFRGNTPDIVPIQKKMKIGRYPVYCDLSGFSRVRESAPESRVLITHAEEERSELLLEQ